MESAQDRQHRNNILVSRCTHHVEGMIADHAKLRPLDAGIHSTHNPPSGHIALQRQVVTVREYQGIARDFDDLAKTKDADLEHRLRECLTEQFATKRTIDVVNRYDGVPGD